MKQATKAQIEQARIEDKASQRSLARAARKSMFIMEASFYRHGSGRYFAMHPTSLSSEMDFCNTWEGWKRKKFTKYALKSVFVWWIQELSETIKLEAPDILHAFLYLDGALENDTPLLEIRLVLWDAFDLVSNRSR